MNKTNQETTPKKGLFSKLFRRKQQVQSEQVSVLPLETEEEKKSKDVVLSDNALSGLTKSLEGILENGRTILDEPYTKEQKERVRKGFPIAELDNELLEEELSKGGYTDEEKNLLRKRKLKFADLEGYRKEILTEEGKKKWQEKVNGKNGNGNHQELNKKKNKKSISLGAILWGIATVSVLILIYSFRSEIIEHYIITLGVLASIFRMLSILVSAQKKSNTHVQKSDAQFFKENIDKLGDKRVKKQRDISLGYTLYIVSWIFFLAFAILTGIEYLKKVQADPLNIRSLPAIGVTGALFLIAAWTFDLSALIKRKGEVNKDRLKRRRARCMSVGAILLLICVGGLFYIVLNGKVKSQPTVNTVFVTTNLDSATAQKLRNEKDDAVKAGKDSLDAATRTLQNEHKTVDDSLQAAFSASMDSLANAKDTLYEKLQDSIKRAIEEYKITLAELRKDSVNKRDSIDNLTQSRDLFHVQRDSGMKVPPVPAWAGVAFLATFFISCWIGVIKLKSKKALIWGIITSLVGICLVIMLIKQNSPFEIVWPSARTEDTTGIVKKKNEELAQKDKEIQRLKDNEQKGDGIKPVPTIDPSELAAQTKRADSLQNRLTKVEAEILAKQKKTVDTTKNVVSVTKPPQKKKPWQPPYRGYSAAQVPLKLKNTPVKSTVCNCPKKRIK